ncbi:selenocysteine lyase isoform X1 [Chlorocebus sabaeus]|uniref:selenocysteine lyase isoform X1 n=1 Tax=Chlorocebus sabaeus TaxID=60711 RepID=UPI0018B03F75|nr:selenocysteine lyase isoform X1 [Chlorocebus sabaeus]
MEAGVVPGRDAPAPAASQPSSCGKHNSPERKVYMDYNATTPLEPEVIQAMTEAMWEAWGNPSSLYPAGRKAKDIINAARESLAKMIGGKPQDIIFTSGGTESNNLVIHSVVKHFHANQTSKGHAGGHHSPVEGAKPHFITSLVEHDSIRLPLEHLAEEQVAAVTFVPVSKVSGQAEVDDILAAVRPTTRLVTIMLANNETGVVMPVPEISQRIKALNQERVATGLPPILVHTDAAQALGKQRVDVEDLGVDFLTIVGHKFYGPRIGALYVRGLGEFTPLYPMLFGGGQERNFRPGTENTPMIAGLGKENERFQEVLPVLLKAFLPSFVLQELCFHVCLPQAAELVAQNCEAYEAHMRDVRDYLEERLEAEFGQKRIHLNSQFPGTQRLPNTCNFSIRGPRLQGHKVLAQCRVLLASVGAACHSDHGDQPSPVLLNYGIPFDVARNALRLSVGRSTTRAEVDLVVQDLKQAVAQLENQA